MYATIVVGTDGSPTASEAVTRAAELAVQSGAKLVIVSAYRPVDRARLEAERASAPADIAYVINPEEDVAAHLEAATELANAAGVAEVRTLPVDAAPAEALLDAAEQVGADLIVVGSQGMAGAKRFLLGSVPNRISHHAPCDVLIVKTDHVLTR
ncbi:universal stress protein [Acidiferrimicrobium sp. IK]|uniref:universal stress protein n=1 Tax=Acidiferrimicrobium sp. IK TaxID=2871700 RepID=UPI0021CB5DD2|nr:universal stress protein [Acidiferrimicrobium sp. IK]MCU4183914.1 universal stress protein [Acidiferrimicrobium sp. IK]